MLSCSLNLHALKGKNKHTLPVFWRANSKLWVMAAIFLDWFRNCFVPQVKRDLVEQNLVFKVLLIDDAPGQPEDLKVAHVNVKVIFLPPNTTSLIQPLDQGVISTFKTYYTCCIFDAMDTDPRARCRAVLEEV